MDWGTIKKVEIGDGKETEGKKYIVNASFEDDQDGRDIQIINLSGLNIRPRVGHKLLVLNIGGFELGICTDDNIDVGLEDGNIEIYSINSDNEKSAKIKMKPDGSIILNDGEDYSVQYKSLKEELDKLKQTVNDLVTSHNSHTHPYVDTPVGSSNTSTIISQATSSSADFTKCKIDSIRVP